MTLRSLGVIPARGGSKGVPGKNKRMLAGKPLVSWTIEAALSSGLGEIVVSTDDDDIISIANSYGTLAPFRRPRELASDTAKTLPVVQHAVEYMERRGERVGIIVLLQPTTPMRTAADIDRGLSRIESTGADSVVSVVDVGGYHPFRMKRIIDEDRLVNYIDQGFEDMRPRQTLPPVYIREGSLYVCRRDLVMEKHTLVDGDVRAIIMDPETSINIDSEADFLKAERLMGRSGK